VTAGSQGRAFGRKTGAVGDEKFAKEGFAENRESPELVKGGGVGVTGEMKAKGAI